MKHFFSGLVLIFVCTSAFGQNVNKESYKRYVDIDKYDQSLEGFIVLNNGKKEKVHIKYEEPYMLFDGQLPLITYNKKNKEKPFLKTKLAGFFVNDRLYVREYFEGDSSRWVMVVREGAIRESIVLQPNIPFDRPEYYSVNRLVTNTVNLTSFYVGRLAINFGLNMSSMIFDYGELNRKVRDAEEGYKFLNYQQIIARYNMWFNSKNPDVIFYMLPRPDYQKFIDK